MKKFSCFVGVFALVALMVSFAGITMANDCASCNVAPSCSVVDDIAVVSAPCHPILGSKFFGRGLIKTSGYKPLNKLGKFGRGNIGKCNVTCSCGSACACGSACKCGSACACGSACKCGSACACGSACKCGFACACGSACTGEVINSDLPDAPETAGVVEEVAPVVDEAVAPTIDEDDYADVIIDESEESLPSLY